MSYESDFVYIVHSAWLLSNNLSRYRITKSLLQLLYCLLQPRLDADTWRRVECWGKQKGQTGFVISKNSSDKSRNYSITREVTTWISNGEMYFRILSTAKFSDDYFFLNCYLYLTMLSACKTIQIQNTGW